MSEKLIQEGLQSIIQGMSEFASGDVVINDWGVMDGAVENAPYVIVETARDFESRQDGQSAVTRWEIGLVLVEAFTDWKETLDNLRDRRQALLDEFNAGDNRSANGLSGVTVDRIMSASTIKEYYSRYLSEEQRKEAHPVYLFQRMTAVCEEF